MNKFILFVAIIIIIATITTEAQIVAPGASVEKVVGGFEFTEGCTVDLEGNLFFSDIPAGKIHRVSPDGEVTMYAKTNRSNGLAVDKEGRLLVCETTPERRLLQIDTDGKQTVVVDRFEGKRFNSLNDLWIDPKGGIYFTDPRYGNRDNMELEKENVYYLSPDRKNIICVCNDLVRPNGVVGSPDAKTLYVADHMGGKTYAYDIQQDGSLTGKRLFATEGADGVTVDEKGNVYLVVKAVRIYNSLGNFIETIETPEPPTNACFGGPNNKTLYITAQTSVYKIELTVKGVYSN